MIHQPALTPSDGTPATSPPSPPRHPEALVRFLDGTWQLCKVMSWERDAGGWRCLLAWGVEGTVKGGWYRPDPERMIPWPPERPA